MSTRKTGFCVDCGMTTNLDATPFIPKHREHCPFYVSDDVAIAEWQEGVRQRRIMVLKEKLIQVATLARNDGRFLINLYQAVDDLLEALGKVEAL